MKAISDIRILPLLMALLTAVTARAAVEDSVLVRRVLDIYEQAAPERVVIYTDKDTYLPGDSVSFRSYVVSVADNLDSQRSNFLYLDLYSNNGWERLSHKKYIRNENGSFSNYMPLPVGLTPGEYTIVGYTQHMLGFPTNTFAYNTIKVSDSIAASLPDCNIGLMPEGGRYVEGAVQVVGVRVTDDPVLTGPRQVTVTDESGQTVYTAMTDNLGYAAVKVRNDSVSRYKVNIDIGGDRVISTEIPKGERDCAALKVSRHNGMLRINILKNGAIDLSAMNVVVRASGVVLGFSADKSGHVGIPLEALPDGYIDIDLVDIANGSMISNRRIYHESENRITTDIKK